MKVQTSSYFISMYLQAEGKTVWILISWLLRSQLIWIYTVFKMVFSDSFTILGLWVLGLAVSNINESPLQTYESKTLFLMTSLPYYCIPGLAETKTYAQKMQDAQVTKSLGIILLYSWVHTWQQFPIRFLFIL